MLPRRKSLLACSFAAATAVALYAQTSVTTQHNDIGRTGQNLTETVLTPSNVNTSTFGKLFSLPVDGQVYAQPLYMPSVTIGGAAHRVVYTATEHNSVYAFDASTGAQLWKVSLMDTAHGAASGATPDPESDTGCGDISALNGADEYGITGTPVIDPTTGTMYIVSKTFEGTYPVQRLHALDITSGAEKFAGPVVISASVSGTGAGSSGGVLKFDAKWENQRAGLLLLNGNVYIGFGSHCDDSPWHGWLLGYNAATLAQTAVFNATPNGSASGIWMGGAGLAADIESGVGRLFPVTGNGTYDSTDYGDDIIRLTQSTTGSLTVADSFTPDNQAALNSADTDVASGGALLLPDQTGTYPHLLVQLGKSGAMYVVNRDSMGGYSTSTNNIVQTVTLASGLWGMPAYWNGNIYVWPSAGKLNQFSVTNGVLSAAPINVSAQSQSSYYGSTPSISANGTTNGIVWSLDWSQTPGVLYAHNATNVSTLLWSSAQNSTRDSLGTPVKFVVPTIADGQVFAAANSQVEVYGLLPAATGNFTLSAFPSAVNVVPGSTTTTQITLAPVNGFTGTPTFSAGNLPAGVTATFSSGVLNSYTLTLTAASSAAVSSAPAPVTITATSGSLTYTLAVPVNVSSTAATPANISSYANVNGIAYYLSPVANGGLDTASYAYAANVLGTSLYTGGIPFSFGTPGVANSAANTTITLPSGSFTTLNLLGTGVNGNQASQSFVVKYTDGTSSTFTQSLSDWGSAQNYSGEKVALVTAYRLTSTGSSANTPWNLYSYSFALNSAKIVQSLVLPANRNVVVVAVTLSGVGTGQVGTTSQTITFNAIATQTANTNLALSATASSGLAVSFASSTPTVCTVSGSTASLLASGTCTIVASQPGNSTYAAATPVSQSFTVSAAAQTITFPTIAAQKVGTPLTLSATASSGLTVAFASSTTTVCTVSGTTATFLTTGSCTIVASQAGNATYAAAPSVSQTFTVSAAPGSFTLSPASTSVTVTPEVCIFIFCFGGASATDQITVTPANGFTGAVTFTISGVPAGITASFSPTSVTTSGSTTLTLAPANLTTSGATATVTIKGTSGSTSASTSITVHY